MSTYDFESGNSFTGTASGYDQIDLSGSLSEYSFTKEADGSVTISHPTFGSKAAVNIDGFWAAGEEKWYSMEDALASSGNGGSTGSGSTGGVQTFQGTEGVEDVFQGELTGEADYFGAGAEYDQVDYAGGMDDYNFVKQANGQIHVFKKDGGYDILDSIEGIWFHGDQKWASIEELTGHEDPHEPKDPKDPVEKLGSIGDTVFLDTNGNGVQDNGEIGVDGVTVQLKDANGNILASQQTSNGGQYLFDQLEAGQYSIGIIKPDGLSLTIQDAFNNGADAIDSDINVDTMMSDIIDLAPGQNITTLDAGLVEDAPQVELGSIGDTVFFDLNENGIQNNIDEGVANVTVELKDAAGNVLDTTVTNERGQYLFEDLEAGDYSVGFIAPDGTEFTEQDARDNSRDDDDSDADVDTGMTDVFTLGEGEDRRDIDAGLIDEKICVDFSVHFHGNGGALTGRTSATLRVSTEGLPAGSVLESVEFGEFSMLWGNYYVSDHPTRDANGESAWTVSTAVFGEDSFGIENAEFIATFIIDGKPTKIRLCGNGEFTYNPPPMSPIVLDMNDDGEIGVTGDTTSIEKDEDAEIGNTVEFDVDADGDLETIEWVDGSGDGILVNSTKMGADGSIDGSALFGDEGGKYANGYEKLAELDTNGDGQVSGDELVDLAVWMDDGDAVVEEGEIVSVTDAGIVSISTEMDITYDDQGRALMQSSATDAEGNDILTEDVWFAEDTSKDEGPGYIKSEDPADTAIDEMAMVMDDMAIL